MTKTNAAAVEFFGLDPINITESSKGTFYQDVAHRSSGKDDWQTPPDLFEKLNKHFNFECDVAASHENRLCNKYFTEEHSCLGKSNWTAMNFMNPPYGRAIKDFVEKAYQQYTDKGHATVALLPVRTGTKWFHEYVYNKADILFLKGRLYFYDSEGRLPNAAPFESMLVAWGTNFNRLQL